MTQEQYQEFRSDFQSIVWYRGQITDKKGWISRLGKFDKNGSHSKAIETAISELDELRKIQNEKLAKYGKTYEQLRECSKKISALQGRIRLTAANVEKYEKLGLKHKINSAKGSHHTALLNFQGYNL